MAGADSWQPHLAELQEMGENCECFIQAQVNIGKGGVVCGVLSKKRHLRSKSWGEGRWDKVGRALARP